MLDDSAVVSAVQSQEWQRDKDREFEVASSVVTNGVNIAAKEGVRIPVQASAHFPAVFCACRCSMRCQQATQVMPLKGGTRRRQQPKRWLKELWIRLSGWPLTRLLVAFEALGDCGRKKPSSP